MDALHYSTFDTPYPVGELTFAVSSRGLAVLGFRGLQPFLKNPHFRNVHWIDSREKTAPYWQKLGEYLAGRAQDLQMDLDLRGTDFQKRCWNALLAIPFGETRSYAEIAKTVGCPQGFRAVGMANNRNPVAIVVPCHRVVESNGKLGGYGGGLTAKEWLLKLEGSRALAAGLF